VTGMTWVWVQDKVVLAIHEAQLAEHAGAGGIRDPSGLASALARPQNLVANGGKQDAASLAACCAFGISRNHPFVDGNKRTAFVVMELFLELNGWRLEASDTDCITAMETLAAGQFPENSFAKWVRKHLVER
jgi:death on curing protein